ncbi:MAG: hypothetical protein QOI29_132 [Mycobacterium sp.]|nr:hypothetical protein [Mycobacterium sp.]
MPSGVLAPLQCLVRPLVRLTQLDQIRHRMYCLLKHNLLLRNTWLHTTFRQAALQPSHGLAPEHRRPSRGTAIFRRRMVK